MLAAAEQGVLSLAGLIAATREGRLVGRGVVPGDERPGGGGGAGAHGCWRSGGDQPTTLAAAREAFLTEEQVVMAQVVLPHDAPETQLERLTRFGFAQAAELLYLSASTDQPARPEPKGELTFEPYRLSQRERLSQLISETYEGSLDCPALDGRRSMEEVLAGYQSTGEFSPQALAVRAARGPGCRLFAAGRLSRPRALGAGIYGHRARPAGQGVGGGDCPRGTAACPSSGAEAGGAGGRSGEPAGLGNLPADRLRIVGPPTGVAEVLRLSTYRERVRLCRVVLWWWHSAMARASATSGGSGRVVRRSSRRMASCI